MVGNGISEALFHMDFEYNFRVPVYAPQDSLQTWGVLLDTKMPCSGGIDACVKKQMVKITCAMCTIFMYVYICTYNYIYTYIHNYSQILLEETEIQRK